MRLDENKTELFEFLATHIANTGTPNKVSVTKGEDVVSNININKHELSPCTHEEADTRFSCMLKMLPGRGH